MLSSTCTTLAFTCRITPCRVHLLCVSNNPASNQPSQFQLNPIGPSCSGIPIEHIPPLPCPTVQIPYALAPTDWPTIHIIQSRYPFYSLLHDGSLLCRTASHCIVYIVGFLHGPALYHPLTLLHCIDLHCGSGRRYRITLRSAINDDSEACGCVGFIPICFRWVSGQCCGYSFEFGPMSV